MIELDGNRLVVSFPKAHPNAKLYIEFQRTLRIPDDGKQYPLPPGLGPFPLRHVDDCAERVPPEWVERAGVVFPMYQSEAMWINFHSEYIEDRDASYPFAVKIAAGKVNAVTGDDWSDGLHRKPQDYLVVPVQPWLDGYCVEKGVIRQFVAMPLGSGYSAEEQIRGRGEYGGVQVVVQPMKREVFDRRFSKDRRKERVTDTKFFGAVDFAMAAAPDMGLAPGGRMRQEIYDDPFGFNDWDRGERSRCFVHIANSLVWRAITGENPPTVPPTAKEYTDAGLPWFEYYDDAGALDGSEILKGLKSIAALARKKGDAPLPENEPVTPKNVVKILRKGLKENQVREGRF